MTHRNTLAVLTATALGIATMCMGAAQPVYGQTSKATSYDCDQIRPCVKKSQSQTQQQTQQSSGQTTTPRVSSGGSRGGAEWTTQMGPDALQSEANQWQALTNSAGGGGGQSYKPPMHK